VTYQSCEIAVEMETAIHDASELQSELNPVPHVDKLTECNETTTAKPVTTRYCYRCGGTHMTHNCFYKDQICHHCGKQGHILRVCRSKQHGKPKQAAKTQGYMLLRLVSMLMLMLMLMMTS